MQTTRQKSPFLINRDFALLWMGQIVSAFGDFLFDTTLTLWIVTQIARGQSWAPLAVGGVLLAASVPVFLIGPLAGVFADRWEKRQTMLRMDAIRAIFIALIIPLTLPLPFLSSIPAGIELGIIYVFVFLTSTCTQFFNPSVLALTGDLVEEPYRARATGLTQMMFSLAMLIGPPLATLLFFTVGLPPMIVFNALSFGISFTFVLLIQAPPAARSVQPGQISNFWHEFTEGLRFFFRNHILVTILIAGFLVVLFEGALNTLGIFFLQQNLHAPLVLYGFLSTALGAGLTLGAFLAGIFAQRLGVTRVLSVGLTLSGIAAIVYARLTNFSLALVVTFLIGFLSGGINVAVGPILYHTTPREFIGRVAAVVTPALALSSLFSVALVSYLDSTLLHNFQTSLLGIHFGPIDTIFLGAGVLATLGGVYAMINLRGVTTADTTEHPADNEPETKSTQQQLTP